MPKVPNTNTFSLADVVSVVNPTTDDLQDCINDANSGYYDPTYYSPPVTSLLEFRNYGTVDIGGNYDSIRIWITNATADGTGFWIRANYATPYLWQDWLGQGMWRYDHFSLGAVPVLSHYRPFYGNVTTGYENMLLMNTYYMNNNGYNIMHVPIYGIWRFAAGTNNITLVAKGLKNGVETEIDSVTVSAPSESIQNCSTYKCMGSQLAIFEYNASTGVGSFSVSSSTNYRGTTNSSGTKSSTSSSTTLKGNLFYAGDAAITEKGFVYKTTDGNNIEIGQTGVTKVVVSGTSLGTYEYTLSRSTDIYYRTYCINSYGTQYGEEVLIDSLDGLGSAGLPTKVEITTITRSGSTITVNWGTVDTGETRTYVLLTRVNGGNWELSLNGPQTDGDDTRTVSTTGVWYDFIVRCFNGDSGQYIDSELKSFYVT
jgi:hypothetical protein